MSTKIPFVSKLMGNMNLPLIKANKEMKTTRDKPVPYQYQEIIEKHFIGCRHSHLTTTLKIGYNSLANEYGIDLISKGNTVIYSTKHDYSTSLDARSIRSVLMAFSANAVLDEAVKGDLGYFINCAEFLSGVVEGLIRRESTNKRDSNGRF